MMKSNKRPESKQELFAATPVPRALYLMAVPTIISQMINLICNMVDAVYIVTFQIINPLWYETNYSRSCAKAILLHFLLRDQTHCGNMKRDN